MGLDCTAYDSVNLVEKISLAQLNELADRDDLYERVDLTFLFNHKVFADRGDGLPDGFYSFGKKIEFCAGSYGGYSHYYRESLAKISGISCDEIYQDPEKYKNIPFFEQIKFPDNEGFLGPRTCKKLLADYENYRINVRKIMKKAQYNWFETYDEFLRGLKFVGENGVLRFH